MQVEQAVIRAEDVALRVGMAYAQRKVRKGKAGQVETFDRLKLEFAKLYASSKGHSDFVIPFWERKVEELEGAMLPYPPFDFLRNKTIVATMNIASAYAFWWLRKCLRVLEKRYSEGELARLLEEDYVGNQIIFNAKYLTSLASVLHLFHLAQFDQATNALKGIHSVVEWGGGYGDQAKVFLRLAPGSTYTIIDLPMISCLQWLYLSSILGEGEVRLLRSCDSVEKGKINLVPLPIVQQVKGIEGDLFLSTWALSECTTAAQDFVLARQWFGAPHLLLATQYDTAPVPNAERVGELARQDGASVIGIPFHPGHSYAFR